MAEFPKKSAKSRHSVGSKTAFFQVAEAHLNLAQF